jgi:ADP-heptose:LPS heptosyltransferase
VVAPASLDLLRHNAAIDRLWPDGPLVTRRLWSETFDLAICLDKEPAATAAMSVCRAGRKLGFGQDAGGNLVALNPEADYALALGHSDELKFRLNEKSYQEIIYEALGREFGGEEYVLERTPEEKRETAAWREGLGLLNGETAIGLNTGAGEVFATKRLAPEQTAALARELGRRGLGKVLLLGGPGEEERNRVIRELAGRAVIDTGCHNPLRSFISLVDACDALVTVDTLAMHLGIALQKKVVALFGPTCHQEVELYGRGVKLVTGYECSPCYRQTCPYRDYCMEDLTVESIVKAVEGVL